jgi:hypothetical protein
MQVPKQEEGLEPVTMLIGRMALVKHTAKRYCFTKLLSTSEGQDADKFAPRLLQNVRNCEKVAVRGGRDRDIILTAVPIRKGSKQRNRSALPSQTFK